MLSTEQITQIADELAAADRTHSVIPRITARYPEATVEDSYAIQGVWRDTQPRRRTPPCGPQDRPHVEGDAAGDRHHGARLRRHVRRHGLRNRRRHPGRPLLQRPHRGRTRLRARDASRRPRLYALRRARGDRLRRSRPRDPQLAYRAGGTHDRRHDRRQRRVRRDGARRDPKRPGEVDLRWVPALLYKNDEIEETGVAAGVLDHPATGVAWLANKLHQHGARLEAGEIILAGSFTRPMWVSRGDVVLCDYGPMGTITCRFS